MDASVLASGSTAHPSFVRFDVFIWQSANAVLIRTDHPRTEFVENLESGLITSEPKLPLELDGGNARRLTGHQVGGPEPYTQRHVGVLHHRPHRQSCIASAFAAPQDARATGDAERVASGFTAGTNEASGPVRPLQIGGAGRFVREKALKLWERPRVRMLLTLVPGGNMDVLPVFHGRKHYGLWLCVNPIGTEHSDFP